MNKQALSQELIKSFQSIIEDIKNTTETYFYKPNIKKWSAAQNLAHLTFSAKIINQGISVPKLALLLRFGWRWKGSRSYNQIIHDYQTASFPAVTGFEPKMKADSTKASESEAFIAIHELVINNLLKWNEKQLDFYVLPHPVLGKLTVRELIYFMIHHLKHHQKAIQKAVS